MIMIWCVAKVGGVGSVQRTHEKAKAASEQTVNSYVMFENAKSE